MLKKLKDPNILLAVAIGYLAPKLLHKAVKAVWRKVMMKRQSEAIHVGIELGGTNYNVSFGVPEFDRGGQVINFRLTKQMSGRTSSNYETTLLQIVRLVQAQVPANQQIKFVGIGSFGPLQLKKGKEQYGYITSTTKPGWNNAPVLPFLKQGLSPKIIEIETDVNSAAYAEFKFGGYDIRESLAYVTVGTGVGVGIVSHGRTIHGLTHPEGGHIGVKRHPNDQNFIGVCPFHESCLQGMVANHSVAKRTNMDYTKLHQLEDSEPVWEIIGNYLAQLCLNITLTVSPEIIVIGGGIMNRAIIMKYIHRDFLVMLNNYIQDSLLHANNIHRYIVSPALGDDVGVKGSLLLKYM